MSDSSNENIKQQALSGVFWRLLERVGALGVQFVVSVILARLLAPELFGTLALITVITSILTVFIDSGLGNALIQKEHADDLDFSSVFFFNITVCALLYLLMFFAAPFIAEFYRMPDLVAPIRVLSLTLIISGVKNIQYAYISRNLQFKRFFFATLGGTVGAAVIGIWMAYNGYGIWALIVQSLFNNTVDTLILWITVRWRPKLMFSFERLKSLFSFGWKLLASILLDSIYSKLSQLIIGRQYSSADLAFYDKGYNFPDTLMYSVNTAIDSILFPVMSSVQSDIERMRSLLRRSITVSTYIIWPMMVGLAACAKPLVGLLLTEKWLPCVPFMQVFCMILATYPIHTGNLNTIKSLGHSEIYLKLEIIKKVLGLIITVITMWISPFAMALGSFVSCIICLFINSYPTGKLIGYGLLPQLKDCAPVFLLNLVMGAAVLSINLLNLSYLVTLLIQVPLGVLIYVAGSALFRFESYTYVLETAKEFLAKKRSA